MTDDFFVFCLKYLLKLFFLVENCLFYDIQSLLACTTLASSCRFFEESSFGHLRLFLLENHWRRAIGLVQKWGHRRFWGFCRSMLVMFLFELLKDFSSIFFILYLCLDSQRIIDLLWVFTSLQWILLIFLALNCFMGGWRRFLGRLMVMLFKYRARLLWLFALSDHLLRVLVIFYEIVLLSRIHVVVLHSSASIGWFDHSPCSPLLLMHGRFYNMQWAPVFFVGQSRPRNIGVFPLNLVF